MTSLEDSFPKPPSRYRALRGKSISSTKPIDVFHDEGSDATPGSPKRRARSQTTSSRRGILVEQSPNVPPLPSFALTPKVDNIPPPPTFKFSNNALRITNGLAAKDISSATKYEQPNPSPVPDAEAAEATSQAEKDDALRRKKEEQDAAHWAEEVARLEAETDRILAEQKKRDIARIQTQVQTPPPKVKLLMFEKLNIFSRRKAAPTTCTQPETPTSVNTAVFSPAVSRGSSLETAPSPSGLVSKSAKLSLRDQPLGFTIPFSALNGSDRRVTIRCLSSVITLPIALDTSCTDVLTAAADMLDHPINASCILMEEYVVLGLERRIRRYERIRDIMNSWDEDSQNVLHIVSRDTLRDDGDLEMASAPQSQSVLSGFRLQLHHSSQPGKWHKRWILLHDSGQMYASKRGDALPGDKDLTSLCHLSDVDIYSPKEHEIRNNLRPPKNFCYGLKSQQKTLVFPHGDNYVHFFCSDDQRLALRFYELVQSWRSWYIVNRQTILEKRLKENAPQLQLEIENSADRSKTTVRQSQISQRSNHMVAFDSLLDLGGFDRLAAKAERLCRDNAAAKQAAKIQETVQEEPEEEAGSTGSLGMIGRIVSPKEKQFPVDFLLGDAVEKLKQDQQNEKGTVTEFKTGSPVRDAATIRKVEREEEPQEEPKEQVTPTRAAEVKTEVKSVVVSEVKDEVKEEPKEEPKSWFPSAAEHTARVRSKSLSAAAAKRPATADGAHRRPPPPLNTTFNRSPEASRFHEQQRRTPPRVYPGSPHPGAMFPGSPVGCNGYNEALAPPPKGLFGRSASGSLNGPPMGGPGPRQRSRSVASPNAARYANHENMPPVPPVPPLPNRSMRRHQGGPPLPPPSVPPPAIPRGRDPRPQRPMVM